MRVAYTVDGWGEGELWFDGTALVWHELPRPRPPTTRRNGPRRFRAHPHPAAQRPVREADQGKGSGETGRFPQRPSARPTRSALGRSDGAPEVRRIIHMLERYFDGERVEFAGLELALDELTPFQCAVAEALRRVPWGEVISYGDLARAAGYANAQRAAGTFCAHNRFPLFLPCHRVVAANGIGSYGSLGIDYKRRLLELEGVAL